MPVISLLREDVSFAKRRSERRPRFVVAGFFLFMLLLGMILGMTQARMMSTYLEDNPGALLFQAG